MIADLDRLDAQISALDLTADVASLKQALELVDAQLGHLSRQAAEFARREEEIQFFKVTRPRVFRWRIYLLERLQLEACQSPAGKEGEIAFLEFQRSYLKRFFIMNGYHYRYYKFQSDELDEKYFLSTSVSEVTNLAELPAVDFKASRPMEYLFAKFQAYELLDSYLEKRINELRSPHQHSRNGHQMKWTGEGVNLAELAYGLQLSGQINNGSIGIHELFRVLNEVFQIDLGIPKRRFDDLYGRKRLSKTHFLDKMRSLLLKKIEDQDAYSPGRTE
ncbi:RteC domain-containing protein [Pedobacter sp. SYP-B3415]|uniref:RteC domain-containing protein n=1 Tax=Pedobacter sp. SYP-B3415 TaxID=2496641 RepID=UPI0013EC2F83|nr:RteC domain-containing protein [Pedobacter sp. SYP-B3415]